MFRNLRFRIWHDAFLFFIILSLVSLDWMIKQEILHSIRYGEEVDLCAGLRLVHWHNYGVSFGLFHDAFLWQPYVLIAVASFATFGLLIWLYCLPWEAHLMRYAIGLIIAGALGNLVDRILFGYVIDYILIYYRLWYWPAFNLADSAISIGVILMIWEQLKREKQ